MPLSIATPELDADESAYDECLSPLPIGGVGGGSKNGSSDEESGSSKKALVEFSSSLRVVLVPSRQEYKEAKCDLWFTGDDFSAFHETARSEVKTFAKSRSITNKEAKIILYQPSTEGEEEDDPYDDYVMGGKSRESSVDSERNLSMDSDSGGGAVGSGWSFSMPLLSPTPLEESEPMGLQRVDSMSILSAKKCKKKHKEKLEREQQKKSGTGSNDGGDGTVNGKYQRSESPEVTPRTERQDSVDESFGAMSSAPLFYEDLHLSVAVPTHIPLPNRERMSKKEAAEKQQQGEEEPPVQMFQILMFFTLPLLGYYLLVYCM